MAETYPRQPGAATFSAARVYDKVGVLVVLAMATGAVSYLANNVALIIVGFLGGFALAMVGIFKPATARFVAPLYALVEGLALGGLSAYYATTSGSGIIPLAIIFTGGIFLGALLVFRSGLVKVTPRFVAMTCMAAVGFLFVSIGLAFGLSLSGMSGSGIYPILGVFGVVIGVAFLFTDFNYIQIAEQRGLPAEGEWYAAFMLMLSLVYVYVNVLRIIGRRR